MSYSFDRHHDILIEAPPEAIYDYVCNPNSWPEWLRTRRLPRSPIVPKARSSSRITPNAEAKRPEAKRPRVQVNAARIRSRCSRFSAPIFSAT